MLPSSMQFHIAVGVIISTASIFHRYSYYCFYFTSVGCQTPPCCCTILITPITINEVKFITTVIVIINSRHVIHPYGLQPKRSSS